MRKDARLILTVDRDSVAAGDDCESHAAATTVSAADSVTALIEAAYDACPLAGIIGGRATWIVYVGGAGVDAGDAGAADSAGTGVRPIAVVAEQWTAPKLLVPATATVAEIFAATAPAVFFRYWCQVDPDRVFEALRAGGPLPSPYG